jgi:hypothetical protein
MKTLAKVLVRVALWAVDHPDTIKAIVDALHQEKATKTAPAA